MKEAGNILCFLGDPMFRSIDLAPPASLAVATQNVETPLVETAEGSFVTG
jgi:hypothetical protein